jgi:hypothetical protein
MSSPSCRIKESKRCVNDLVALADLDRSKCSRKISEKLPISLEVRLRVGCMTNMTW